MQFLWRKVIQLDQRIIFIRPHNGLTIPTELFTTVAGITSSINSIHFPRRLATNTGDMRVAETWRIGNIFRSRSGLLLRRGSVPSFRAEQLLRRMVSQGLSIRALDIRNRSNGWRIR